MPNSPPLHIASSQLAVLCPTYLRIDRSLNLTAYGPSIARLVENVRRGAPFWDSFKADSPMDFVSCAQSATPVRFTSLDGGLSLRGMALIEKNGFLLFVSPEIRENNEPGSEILQLTDFSIIDQSLSTLVSLGLRDEMLAEIDELTAVQAQRIDEIHRLYDALS